MDLLKCPRCGEMYSSSYRRCPFCEEEARPRKQIQKRGGHHVSEKKHTHSARGPFVAVLLIVLAILTWYLFGDRFMEKLRQDQEPSVDVVTPPTDSAEDPGTDQPVSPDVPVPPSVEDPEPVTPPAEEEPTPVTPPAEEPAPSVDPAGLTMKTNVGSLSRDQGTGKYDCTVKTTETIRLIVQGTDVQTAWASADTSVVTVDADGTLHPVKAGTAVVTATVGSASLECIVRVK